MQNKNKSTKSSN